MNYFSRYLLMGYRTPSAALHGITEASSKEYVWCGITIKETFIGVMWRIKRNTESI
jgi:hypothetical protein